MNDKAFELIKEMNRGFEKIELGKDKTIIDIREYVESIYKWREDVLALKIAFADDFRTIIGVDVNNQEALKEFLLWGVYDCKTEGILDIYDEFMELTDGYYRRVK